MPPENLGRDTPKSNVYSAMLILAFAFIFGAWILCYVELKNQYGLFGGRGVAVDDGGDVDADDGGGGDADNADADADPDAE